MIAVETTDFEERVERFETARRAGRASPADYAPGRSNPERLPILRELLRIDIEYGWSVGEPPAMADYRRDFPEIFEHPELSEAVYFEYLRQQRLWESEQGEHTESHRTKTVAASEIVVVASDSDASAAPKVGEEYCGFQLVAELGCGSFGRVYLAHQTSLAARPVALKIAKKLFDESQVLARLQHTHIMPIYSMHADAGLQAVCMPYLGATTLADLIASFDPNRGVPTSGSQIVSAMQDRRVELLQRASGSERSFQRMLVHSTVAPAVTDPEQIDPVIDAAAPIGRAIVAVGPVPAALKDMAQHSYIDAVLTLADKLADALCHAHEHGVVHHDLKPANVLLTDDGEPVILDFNLSSPALESAENGARVGGTIPYMAPEQLRGLGRSSAVVDARADLYSVGLILYELLTGRLPFPTRRGPRYALLAEMLVDREQPVPPIRAKNPAVSPATEAIVLRLLESDPTRRYASARELKDDLECQLASRPLRHTAEPSLRERFDKWVRRHPTASSTTTVSIALLGVVGCVALFANQWRERVLTRSAYDRRAAFFAAADRHQDHLICDPEAVRRGEHLAQVLDAVNQYSVAERSDWREAAEVSRLAASDRARLAERMGEVLLLAAQTTVELGATDDARTKALAYNDWAARCFSEAERPRAWLEQRVRLLAGSGDPDVVRRLVEQLKQTPVRTGLDRFIAARQLAGRGEYKGAIPPLQAVLADEPKHFWARYLLGVCLFQLGEDPRAADTFRACEVIDPNHWAVHRSLGQIALRQGLARQAEAHFARAAELAPEDVEVRLALATVRQKLGKLTAAREDCDWVAGRADAPTRVFFLRAALRAAQGDVRGATVDRAEGLRREPNDELSFIARGMQRLEQPGEAAAALADFRAAEKCYPRSFDALQNQAHALSEFLHRDDQSLAVLDRLLLMYPDAHQALAGRAVLLARVGRVDDALRDVQRCLAGPSKPIIRYQLAGVFARTADRPGHLNKALQLLADAILDGDGLQHLPQDPDLDAIRARPEFRALLDAATTLKRLREN